MGAIRDEIMDDLNSNYSPGPMVPISKVHTSTSDYTKFKADAGKAMPDLLEMGFPNALRLVQATLEYGAKKYEAHSWRQVPNALERYNRAGRRHRQERDLAADPTQGFYAALYSHDDESGLPHIAHEVFNLLAMMELELADEDAQGHSKKEYMAYLLGNMKEPPTDHKE